MAIDSNIVYWPETIPTPLIGRRVRTDPRSVVSPMESRRSRVRRLHEGPIKLFEVTWNFTLDQYDEFRTFFIETLEHGENLFAMVTLEQAPSPTKVRQWTRALAFYQDYTFTTSDNLVAVEAVLEVDAEEFNEITNPFYVNPRPDAPPPPIIVVEFTSLCRETVKFTWALADTFTPGMDVIQAAEAEAGPWFDYIVAIPETFHLESGLMTVLLNNSFQGNRWFQLTRNGDVIASPAKPQASVIAPPNAIEISNTYSSPYALHGTGPFIRPVSYLENFLINTTEVYVEPLARREYYRANNWDGIPTVVTVPEVVDEGTVKWTRDGTDPTADMPWPIPRKDGALENAQVYKAGFAFQLKARCFAGECRSPLVIILIDVCHDAYSMVTGWGRGNGVWSSCDYDKIVFDFNPATQEFEEKKLRSGMACPTYLYEMRYDAQTVACASAAIAPLTTNHHPASGKNFLWNKRSSQSEINNAGWLGYFVQASKWRFLFLASSGYRNSQYWDLVPQVWEYVKVKAAANVYQKLDLNAPVTVDPEGSSFEKLTTGPGRAASPIAGLGGVITSHAQNTTDFLLSLEVPCFGPFETSVLFNMATLFTEALVNEFEVRTSLQNDEQFDIPLVPFVPPEPPVVPEVPIFGDDFEAYLDTEHAEDETLDQGTGWDGDWVVSAYPVLFGEDDMESYADGPVLDTVDADPITDPVYDGGGGWDGPWVISTSEAGLIGGDDFQSYADGEVASFQLAAGERWEPELFWWVWPTEPGGDDFNSHADGVVVTGDLVGGTKWIAEGWFITNY